MILATKFMQGAGLGKDATVADLFSVTGWEGAKTSLLVRHTHVDFVLFHFFRCAFPGIDFDEVTLAMVEDHFELNVGDVLQEHAQEDHASVKEEAQESQAPAQEALEDDTRDTVRIVFPSPPPTSTTPSTYSYYTLQLQSPPPPSPPSHRSSR